MQINNGPMQAGGSVGGEIRPPSAPMSMPPTEQAPFSAPALSPVATETPSDMPLPAVENPLAPPEQPAPPEEISPDQMIVPDASVSAQQGVNIPVSPDVPSQNIDPAVLTDNPATDSDPAPSPEAPPQVSAGSAPVNLEDHHGLEAIVAGNSGLPQDMPETNLGQVANADQFVEQAGGVVPAPPSSAPEISANASTPSFINTSGLPPEPPMTDRTPAEITVDPNAQAISTPGMGQDSLGALREAERGMSELQKVLNDLTPEQRDAWANFLKSLGYGDNEVETNRGEAQ